MVSKELKVSSKGALKRLRDVQHIVEKAKVDGLLLVAGVDSNYDLSSAQLLSYLFESKSGYKLFETSMVNQMYEDLVVLVKAKSISVYCQNEAHEKVVSLLACGIEGCHIYCPTEEEEKDTDLLEEYKIGSFVQMVRGLKTIGTPCKEPLKIESWPLIQSYGIEGIGKSGFFTMNFKCLSLNEELSTLYPQVDGQAFLTLLQNSLPMFKKHADEVFSLVGRESLYDLMEMEESDIIEPFIDYYNCRDIRNVQSAASASIYTRPRVLAGQHSQKISESGEELSLDVTLRSMQSESDSLAHFIVELVDPKTPLACTRTCFLSSTRLREGEGRLYPSDEDLYEVDDFQAVKNQWDPSNVLYLYHCYISLIDAGRATMEFFSTNITAKYEEIEKVAQQTYQNSLVARGLEALPLVFQLEEMDLAGNVFPAKVGSKQLKRFKLTSNGLKSRKEGQENELLGSVSYGETFIDCGQQYEVLSSSIPLTQSWPIFECESITQKYMHKLLKRISDESLVSSDRSHNEMTAFLGDLVIEGAEQVTILISNKYMPSIKGELYFFAKGFVFFSPAVLPIVVNFEEDLKSFTRYVPDSNNVMSTAVLLFELRETFVTGFDSSSSSYETELVGLALGTLEPSACRYFNQKVWPLWMDILSAGGMKVATESVYPEELWDLHEYSSSEKSKSYPLLLSDEMCEKTASYLDGESLSRPAAKEVDWQSSIPIVVIVGIPGSGHEKLTGLLVQNAADNCEWKVVKQPLADLIDREDRLHKYVGDALPSLEEGGKKQGLLLPLVGYSDLRPKLKSLLSSKPFQSGKLRVCSIIGCLHTENLVSDGRSLYYKGIFEQLLEGYVDTVVIFGSESHSPSIKTTLRSRLPKARLLNAQSVVGSSLLGQPAPDFSAMALKDLTPEHAEDSSVYQKVFVTSMCSILEDEQKLVSILQKEMDKSMEVLRSRPSLQDLESGSTSLVWLKIAYNCPVSKAQKELSMTGREVKITKVDSEQVSLSITGQEVQWIFVGQNLSEKHVKKLIEKCVQPPQEFWKVREPADLRATEKQEIQKEHLFDPLPEGFRFTGSDYVDMDGNISKWHPDFDKYAMNYLEEENKEAQKKNAQIQSYNADLVELQVREIRSM